MSGARSIRLRSAPARRVVTGEAGAAECIGRLEPGGRVVGLTGGQFSLVELALAILAQTGPADVILSTWSVAVRDMEALAGVQAERRWRTLRIITDRNIKAFEPSLAGSLVSLFGAGRLAVCQIHAKFLLVRNERWTLACTSSMNLNRNPRIEHFDLSDDATLCGWLWERAEDIIREGQDGGEFAAEVARAAYKAALGAPEVPPAAETHGERMRREIAEARARLMGVR